MCRPSIQSSSIQTWQSMSETCLHPLVPLKEHLNATAYKDELYNCELHILWQQNVKGQDMGVMLWCPQTFGLIVYIILNFIHSSHLMYYLCICFNQKLSRVCCRKCSIDRTPTVAAHLHSFYTAISSYRSPKQLDIWK